MTEVIHTLLKLGTLKGQLNDNDTEILAKLIVHGGHLILGKRQRTGGGSELRHSHPRLETLHKGSGNLCIVQVGHRWNGYIASVNHPNTLYLQSSQVGLKKMNNFVDVVVVGFAKGPTLSRVEGNKELRINRTITTITTILQCQ